MPGLTSRFETNERKRSHAKPFVCLFVRRSFVRSLVLSFVSFLFLSFVHSFERTNERTERTNDCAKRVDVDPSSTAQDMVMLNEDFNDAGVDDTTASIVSFRFVSFFLHG